MFKSVEVNNSHVVVVDLLNAPPMYTYIDAYTVEHYRCGYIHNEQKKKIVSTLLQYS